MMPRAIIVVYFMGSGKNDSFFIRRENKKKTMKNFKHITPLFHHHSDETRKTRSRPKFAVIQLGCNVRRVNFVFRPGETRRWWGKFFLVGRWIKRGPFKWFLKPEKLSPSALVCENWNKRDEKLFTKNLLLEHEKTQEGKSLMISKYDTFPTSTPLPFPLPQQKILIEIKIQKLC